MSNSTNNNEVVNQNPEENAWVVLRTYSEDEGGGYGAMVSNKEYGDNDSYYTRTISPERVTLFNEQSEAENCAKVITDRRNHNYKILAMSYKDASDLMNRRGWLIAEINPNSRTFDGYYYKTKMFGKEIDLDKIQFYRTEDLAEEALKNIKSKAIAITIPFEEIESLVEE